jgi:hypothetical protein
MCCDGTTVNGDARQHDQGSAQDCSSAYISFKQIMPFCIISWSDSKLFRPSGGFVYWVVRILHEVLRIPITILLRCLSKKLYFKIVKYFGTEIMGLTATFSMCWCMTQIDACLMIFSKLRLLIKGLTSLVVTGSTYVWWVGSGVIRVWYM